VAPGRWVFVVAVAVFGAAGPKCAHAPPETDGAPTASPPAPVDMGAAADVSASARAHPVRMPWMPESQDEADIFVTLALHSGSAANFTCVCVGHVASAGVDDPSPELLRRLNENTADAGHPVAFVGYSRCHPQGGHWHVDGHLASRFAFGDVDGNEATATREHAEPSVPGVMTCEYTESYALERTPTGWTARMSSIVTADVAHPQLVPRRAPDGGGADAGARAAPFGRES
jgi:hypothetical protein